jgi:DNA repair exonuclease SbcCD ATPase subunit
MAALDTLFQKVPNKVFVILIGLLVVVLVLVLSYAVLVQKRPVDLWGLRLGESVEELQTKLAAAEAELRGRVPAKLYEEAKERGAQAETRAQDLLRETDRLKRTAVEMQATAQRAATTSDLLRRSETEVGQLRAQVADLIKRARETESELSEWRKKYEASAGRVKNLTEELDSVRRTYAGVFTVLVSGTFQKITVIEGDSVRGESTTLGGQGEEKVFPVPKDRPIRLSFTGNNNVVTVPRSVLVRLTVEDNGFFNKVVERP